MISCKVTPDCLCQISFKMTNHCHCLPLSSQDILNKNLEKSWPKVPQLYRLSRTLKPGASQIWTCISFNLNQSIIGNSLSKLHPIIDQVTSPSWWIIFQLSCDLVPGVGVRGWWVTPGNYQPSMLKEPVPDNLVRFIEFKMIGRQDLGVTQTLCW